MDGESVSLGDLAAGTYIVRVFGYNGSTNTNYSLTINAPFSSLSADAYEPNESHAAAADLGNVEGTKSVTGLTIGATGDVDWYKFTTLGGATAADYARILFSNSSGDLDLELYDASGNMLGKSAGSSNMENISLSGKVAGTYYLKVYGYNGAINNYTLSLQTPAADLASDAYESNDSFAASTDLGLVSGVFSAAQLTISSTSDVDYFKFTLGAAGTADNSASVLFDQSAGDLDLRLYDSNQTLLATADTTNGAETISLAREAGTYYLVVYGYHGAQNGYTLTINAPTAGPVAPDGYEGDEPLRLSQDQTVTGLTVHDPAQNEDFGDRADAFVFTTVGRGTSTDFIQIEFSAASGNLKLMLENANHVVLSTASAGVGAQRISLSGYAAGTYYVVVDSADPQAAPENRGYSLAINAPFAGEDDLPMWTLLVYVDGDNNLEDAALADVNEMEAAASNPNAQIGVLLDRIPGGDSTNGNWTDTRRGIIARDSNTTTISSTLTSLGEKDMSSVNTLKDFISWGISTLPAQNYMLIIWNHGAAIEGAAFDDTTGNDVGLSLAAINQALASSAERIDILGFDACLMATVETLSAVSDSTDYLVASEQTEGNDGWNYTSLINSITATTDPTTLASNLVQQAQGNSSISTLSAVRTGDALDAAIADFVSAVLNNGTAGIYDQLESARRATPSYDYDYMHDLGGFMRNVKNLVDNNAIVAAAQETLDALDDAVVNNYSTASEDGTGLTIYLPAQNESILSIYANLSFSLSTGWRALLKAIKNGVTTATTSIGTRDWAESNDYLAAATNLNALTTHGHSYAALSINTSTDIDWFRFGIMTEGTASDQASIAFDHSVGNLDLYLYDSDGTLIVSSASTTDGVETVSLNGLAVGEYYLKIAGVSGATNSNYSLTIDAPETNNGDWAEDNSAQQKATALSVGELIGGLTLTTDDVDWYTFQANRLPSINPIVVTALYDSAQGSLNLQLYDATENIVAESTATATGAKLEYSSFTEGAYWLRVTGTPTNSTLPYSLSAEHDFTTTLQSDSTAPTAKLKVTHVLKTGGKVWKFTVVYTDPSGVNASSVGAGDIQVKCGTKFKQNAALLSKNTSGNTVTARYQIKAPGGTWNLADRGTYTVYLMKKQVKDSAGNWNAATKTLGSFKAFPKTVSTSKNAISTPQTALGVISRSAVFSSTPIAGAVADILDEHSIGRLLD